MPAQNRSTVDGRLAVPPQSRLIPLKRESDHLLERLRKLIRDRRAKPTAVTGGSLMSFPHGARRRRLVQLANDAYREWREHCAQLTRAYGCWADGDSSNSEQAWEAYEDALALEEIAAERYAARAASVGLLNLDPMMRR